MPIRGQTANVEEWSEPYRLFVTPDSDPIGADLTEYEQMKSKGYKIPPAPLYKRGEQEIGSSPPLVKGGRGDFSRYEDPKLAPMGLRSGVQSAPRPARLPVA